MNFNLICKKSLLIFLLAFLLFHSAAAQSVPLSEQLVNALIKLKPGFPNSDNLPGTSGKFYKPYFLQGIDAVWRRTAKGMYFDFFKTCVDQDLMDGSLQNGKELLALYKVTEDEKYYDAATIVMKRLQTQLNYKDEVFRNAGFYAAYAVLNENEPLLNDIVQQLMLVQSGLVHIKPNVYSNTMLGQYGASIVDVLDYIPTNNPNHKKLIRVLNLVSEDMNKLVSGTSGAWSAIAPENECLFLYTLAKSKRLGYLHKVDRTVIEQGIIQMKKYALSVINDKNLPNILKDTGAALLLAVNEMEISTLSNTGKAHVILLDSYFNNETKMDRRGHLLRWHYKWDERDNNGFSMWGGQFQAAGFQLSTLYTAPTASALKKASVYIIVDPDSKKENKLPNFIQRKDVKTLEEWVKGGGVLVLMANDSANVELDHFNTLASAFGIQFNKDSQGKVTGNQYEMGSISIPDGSAVFTTARKVFIKEFSSLNDPGIGHSILKDKTGKEVVCTVELGRGHVLFIGDPWLYNEYVDGRKLPENYDNFKAGADIVAWISNQLN
jgi:unsaturated rhamnogalacturonyl hydrolase